MGRALGSVGHHLEPVPSAVSRFASQCSFCRGFSRVGCFPVALCLIQMSGDACETFRWDGVERGGVRGITLPWRGLTRGSSSCLQRAVRPGCLQAGDAGEEGAGTLDRAVREHSWPGGSGGSVGAISPVHAWQTWVGNPC